MRSFVVVLILTLCVSVVAMAEGPGRLVGSVEAVYHEGLMTFQVNQADAVSASVRVYDLQTDALVYDSGPRAQTLVSWPAGHDVVGAFRYVVTAWNEQGEVVVSQAAVTKTLDLPTSISFDTIPGGLKALGPNEVIIESDLQVGNTQGVRIDALWGSSGGAVNWYEEDGSTTHTRIEPDGSGEGGYVYVDGTVASGSYVRITGMGANSEADLYVQGTSDFGVWAGNTGDASVTMPASAVGSAEMANEPGVAAMTATSAVTFSTSGYGSILARGLTAPTAGYVLAIATFDVQLHHVNGTYTSVTCGHSLASTAIPTDSDHSFNVTGTAPTGYYQTTGSLTKIYPVSAGYDNYYVACNQNSTGTSLTYDRHLDLVFFPTAYGAITTPADGMSDGSGVLDGESLPGHPMTQAEIDAEEAKSIAFNLARIQAELAAIQAQADAIEAATDDNQP